MLDFRKIGGEITSAPLNENFRKLRNDISISNMNMIFSDTDGIKNTLDEMYAIENPDDAQVCYVISNGCFYRYSKGDGKWHKIMDIGQTFRQGFLNSGAVVLEDYIKAKDTKTLIVPNMLIYFKNKPGDERYLKGMYLIQKTEIEITPFISGANSYSLLVDSESKFTIIPGMPQQDDPSHVFLGTFLVNSDNNILEDFVYTLPDMAFTADRGYFLLNGGEANGCNLVPSDTNNNKVNRMSGYYYDEGINFTIGDTSNYPVDSDNGSNYDLKVMVAEHPVSKLYYMTPSDPLTNDIIINDGLIINKYWVNNEITDVPNGYFTIQQHLVTPSGQNIILYGEKLYNSITDAVSNLNTTYGLNINFPYIQATKIVVGNVEDFDSADSGKCQFFTLGRLSQVGTISPEFADNVFKIYSGDSTDITPSTIRFDLKQLQEENFDRLYSIGILPYNTERDLFSLDAKYITNDIIEQESKLLTDTRTYLNDEPGYNIADNKDIDYLKNRVSNIEKEIWNIYDEGSQRYEQSIRYRLFNSELAIDEHSNILNNHEQRITNNENTKVNKDTTINGYKLGDNNNLAQENKNIIIYTGDISEGQGLNNKTNLWYTNERVSNNPDVKSAKNHILTISASDNASAHAKVNPHNLSTDDINILADTTKIFVTPEEERRIRSDRLPENTIQALKDLDNKNLDSISIDYFNGSSINPGDGPIHFGDIKNITFFKDGVNLSLDENGETLYLECIGQINDDTVMFKTQYATLEKEYPNLYEGYVDKAVNADFANGILGLETATANQYYGTNNNNEIGIYNLPIYVSTVDGDSFADINQVIFAPIDASIQEKHLVPELANKINNNYHTIYNNGVLKSNEINTLSFGDNLTVTIENNTATINASGTGGAGVNNFVNLQDVNVTYTNNKGKMLVVNNEENGIILSDVPELDDFMLKSIYVDSIDPTKVKKAKVSDTAATASTATNALALNNKIVDDNKTGTGYLWTSNKIISNTSKQIEEEGVKTYDGTEIPDDSLGKNGDIYVMVEG